MDFVVVGFGLGALGVLLGVVMLGWLAPRAQRAAARASSSDGTAHELAVAAEHQGTGQAFLYGGGAMLLATVAGLAGALDDRTGAFLVTTTATVAAIGILIGGYLQRARNPVPRRMPSPPIERSTLSADPLANESLVLTDGVPVAAASTLSPPDRGDAWVDPASEPGADLDAPAIGDDAPIPGAIGGTVFGEDDLDWLDDGPTDPSPGTESRPPPDPPRDHQSDDATPVQEEDVVVAGIVIPPARPEDSSAPPPWRDDGGDP